MWKWGELSLGLSIHMVMLTMFSSPSRPSSTHPLARTAAGVKRWFRLIPYRRPFSLARATISRALGTSLEMGFSPSTAIPASSRAMVGS